MKFISPIRIPENLKQKRILTEKERNKAKNSQAVVIISIMLPPYFDEVFFPTTNGILANAEKVIHLVSQITKVTTDRGYFGENPYMRNLCVKFEEIFEGIVPDTPLHRATAILHLLFKGLDDDFKKNAKRNAELTSIYDKNGHVSHKVMRYLDECTYHEITVEMIDLLVQKMNNFMIMNYKDNQGC